MSNMSYCRFRNTLPDLNTRRFPRSTMEAFRTGAEYDCAIERPAPNADRAVKLALWLAVVFLVVLIGLEKFV